MKARKKRKGFIRRLFNFIFGLLVIVILLVVILLIMISNGSRNYDYLDNLDTTSTVDSILLDKVYGEINDLSDYSIDISLNENDINNLIYSAIKNSINPSYNPIEGTTLEEKNIKALLIEGIPLINTISCAVTDAYTTISNDVLTFEIDAEALGFIKTKLLLSCMLETTDTDYVFSLTSLTLGRINLTSNFGKKVLNILKKNFNLDSNISLGNGLSIKADFDNYQFRLSRADFASYLKSIVNTNDPTISEIINIATNPDNKALNLSITDNNLSFDGKLDALATKDKPYLTLISQKFDQSIFIQNKVQSLTLTSIASGKKDLVFNYSDINKILYDKTNGYQDLNVSLAVNEKINLNVTFDEISFASTDTNVTLKLLFSINGLKSKAFITFDILQLTDDVVYLVMKDTFVLGEDNNISTTMISSILAQALTNFDFFSFDEQNNRLVFSKDIFANIINQIDLNSTLAVEKISFNLYGLVLTTEFISPVISEKFVVVAQNVVNVLGTDFLDTSKLSNQEQEVIDSVVSSLDNLKTSINNNDLSTEDVNDFVESLNSLSNENQEELLSQIENSMTQDELDLLKELYNDLFN